MLQWLKYLRALPTLLSLVRQVLDLVRSAEDILAGGERGAAKKALVLNVLDATVALGQQLGIPEAAKVDRAALRAAAGPLIDTLVAILNAAGVFKHGPT